MPTNLGNRIFFSGDDYNIAANQGAWEIPKYGFHGNDETGFAATLYRNSQTKQHVLAIRGTEPFRQNLIDLGEDIGRLGGTFWQGGIGDVGLALNQAVELVNYIRQMLAPAGAVLQKLVLEHSKDLTAGLPGSELHGTTLDYSKGLEQHHYTAVWKTEGSFSGLGLVQPGEKLVVTGHSLGGHLAAIAQMLFPNLFDQAYLYNAPGFDSPASSGQTQNLLNLFHNIAVAFPSEFPNLPVAGPGSKTVEQYLSELARTDKLFAVESENLAPGDDGSGVAGIATRADLYDPVVEVPVERNYATQLQLEKYIRELKQGSPGVQLVLLGDLSASDLASLAGAAGGEAYRFALKELLPFAITGLDYRSRDGLALFNSKTGTGDLSEQWLRDRAELLHWQLRANQVDAEPGQVLEGDRPLHLQDMKTGFEQDVGAINRQHILFGDDAANALSVTTSNGDHRLCGGAGNDSLTGANYEDYLEGGADNDELKGLAGRDTLVGGRGNDVLVGGEGNDLLQGGEGNDRYEFSSGDGTDVIDDPNGVGELWIDGVRYSTAKPPLPIDGFWLSDDKKVTFILGGKADGTGTLTVRYGNGDSVLIQHYHAGGFAFGEYEAKEEPELPELHVIAGDLKYIDFDPTLPGDQTKTDTWGNIKVHPEEAKPGTDDGLFDTDGNDWLKGLGGDDDLTSRAGGDDLLDGGAGDDVLSSSDGGRDTLLGGGGRDRLFGGKGDDALYGEEQVELEEALFDPGQSRLGGDGEWLSAGEGDDLLVGGRGGDVLLGGKGEDTLIGGDGDDLLQGDGESDWADLQWKVVRGTVQSSYTVEIQNARYALPLVDGDDDLLFGGAGADWMFGGGGNDYLNGGSGNDLLMGAAGSDTLLGEDGDDVLIGEAVSGPWYGSDVLYGGAGKDTLYGGEGNDSLFGGQGDDSLYGDNANGETEYSGQDWLDGGEGNDTLRGGGDNDTLLGGDGNDSLVGDNKNSDSATHGDDLLDGGDGNDSLFGLGGSDTLLGGVGNDVLTGDALIADGVPLAVHGDDYLDGGAGNDSLWGGGGRDTLLGGEGADWLLGDEDGMPALYQGSDYLDGGAGNDTIYGYLGDDTLIGGAGNDTLRGGDGRNYLDGGTGSDVLQGGADADTYVFGIGYGADLLQDSGGTNIVRFGPGLSAETLAVSIRTDALLHAPGKAALLLGSTPDVLIIEDFTAMSHSRFVFADGTELSFKDIMARVGEKQHINGRTVADELYGTRFDDTLQGMGANDTLYGGEGNDMLYGSGGNDSLLGGLGNDVLDGGDGSDQLNGDAGNDTLQGGAQSDSLVDWEGNNLLQGGGGDDQVWGRGTLSGGQGNDEVIGSTDGDFYLFARGDGVDTLYDWGHTTSTDILRLGAGIQVSDVQLSRSDEHLVLSLGAGDQITVKNWYRDSTPGWNNRIEQIQFADGSAWTVADQSLSLVAAAPLQASLESQVHNLINSMAAFGVPAPAAETPLATQRQALEVMLAVG